MANDGWLDLCDEIDNGEFDEGLREIAKTVASRLETVQRRAARRLMRSLAVGDKVKLGNGIKPRYLNGMVGHITKMRDGAADVKLTKTPTPQGAGRPPVEGYKDHFTIPFEHLTRLDADVEDLNEVDMAADIGDDSDDMEEEDED